MQFNQKFVAELLKAVVFAHYGSANVHRAEIARLKARAVRDVYEATHYVPGGIIGDLLDGEA